MSTKRTMTTTRERASAMIATTCRTDMITAFATSENCDDNYDNYHYCNSDVYVNIYVDYYNTDDRDNDDDAEVISSKTLCLSSQVSI